MKFKKLTEEDKEYIASVYKNKDLSWDDRMVDLCNKFSISERQLRRWCSEKLGLKERVEGTVSTEQLEVAKTKELNSDKKFFLITAVQNASKINLSFWNNLKTYAEYLDAQILVIPYTYHNPTNPLVIKEDGDMWWPKEVEDYLTLNRHNINENFSILSDVVISPTAIMPLTNLESMTGEHSCCVASPRIHMKSLPVFGDRPKLMFTTGTLSKPNFTKTKIGKISEFHSTYGALLIEKDGKEFYARQITGKDNGSFNDLWYHVDNENISRNKSVPALIKGDTHYPFVDKNVHRMGFEDLVPKLNPNEIFLHDLIDFRSINHHEANNFVKVFRNQEDGLGSVEKEIEGAMQFLEKIKHLNIRIVNSNHDRFLESFIIDSDIKKAGMNTLQYLEYAKVLLEDKAPKGLLAYIIEKRFPEIKCFGRDDSYIVKGVELACHGSDGIGGSRGNAKQFKSLNIKVITAHGHNALRYDGSAQVGCNCDKRLGYNHSASAWVHSDIILHNDGKFQHIFYLGPNSEYTILK